MRMNSTVRLVFLFVFIFIFFFVFFFVFFFFFLFFLAAIATNCQKLYMFMQLFCFVVKQRHLLQGTAFMTPRGRAFHLLRVWVVLIGKVSGGASPSPTRSVTEDL